MTIAYDATDLTWVSRAHRVRVTAGRIPRPPSPSRDHAAVLVSIPAEQEPVWVDRKIAGLVWSCNQAGYPTVESCEDDCGMVGLWFASRGTRDRFVEDHGTDAQWEAPGFRPRGVAGVWLRLVHGQGVWLQSADVPRLTARLFP